MSHLVVDPLDTAWVSSDAALQASVDASSAAEPGGMSLLLSAPAGAAGAVAEVTVPSLDLADYSELRLWIRGSRRADGSPEYPYYLAFGYEDAGDAAADIHRWFLPVNRPGRWEQRRIGIEADRRDAVESLRLTALTAAPFSARLDELIAVREELIGDVEDALVARLDVSPALPGAVDVPVTTTVNTGTQVTLVPSEAFAPGNRVRLHGGTGADEDHDVVSVVQQSQPPRTTLQLHPARPINGTFTAGSAGVTLLAPVLVEAPPAVTAQTDPTPAVVLTQVDVQEDRARGGEYLQRDSFREHGGGIVCSVRPAARPYRLDYQVTLVAPRRDQQRALHEHALEVLTGEPRLRVNGAYAPLTQLPAPVLEDRTAGVQAPLYIRVGTRREVAPRETQPWVRTVKVAAAPADAPADSEVVEVVL